jgi:endogenous inhibitor of DNA gyrase (YacG/DUF329 family)
MALKFENQIRDDLNDDVGRCLRALHAHPTWTAAKVAAFKHLEEVAAQEGYLRFTGDFRSYHLERKGESCLYDIPMTQRGALQPFCGKRVRLICAGGWDPYAGRYFLVKVIIPSARVKGRRSARSALSSARG